MKNITIKIPEILVSEIKKDLLRAHPHAQERAGFVFGRSVKLGKHSIILLNQYQSIPDNLYIKNPRVGASINSTAIKNAFRKALKDDLCIFHVHLHEFDEEIPVFSTTDENSLPDIIFSAQELLPNNFHGMLVYGKNKANAKLLYPKNKKLKAVDCVLEIGNKIKFSFPKDYNENLTADRQSRQEFLGKEFQSNLPKIKIGIVGLSGGGSHLVQQLAHIGFKKFALSDPQNIELSNLNRLVSATLKDVGEENSKFSIAKRTILNLHEDAIISGGVDVWQNLIDDFKNCDVIFGALDTLAARRDLEAFCRRYFIPLVDIGMGIDKYENFSDMYGQVQVSTPGKFCFRCNKFITEENLAKEAKNYGQGEGRPQVVWPNGILASTAIGSFIEMISNWSNRGYKGFYFSYNGNENFLNEHPRLNFLNNSCKHYPIEESGPVKFIKT